jgi:SAM-dependent methyltransferase
MPSKSSEDPFRRLAEDLRRNNLEALLSLQDRLRRYAGMPGVADDSSRTAIREYAVILAIADLLDLHPRTQFRVLDACCGKGGLALHLANNLSGKASKVAYLGIDQNSQLIGTARKSIAAKAGLHSVEYRIGEVWHMPVEWHSTIDLVVLSNTLHELPPHKYPELFSIFNQVITQDVGRVCVIDMEELPLGEPEAVAINWRLEEVEAILKAGGFEVAPSNHPKSVGVFRAVVKHAKVVNPLGMLSEIRLRLRKKLSTLAQERVEFADEVYEDDDSLLNWVVLTGSVARCTEELLLVEDRIASLSASQAEKKTV